MDNAFRKINFTTAQIESYLNNALKDLQIAGRNATPEVKFTYSYTALLKAGIAIIAAEKSLKVRSVPGHHVKILEMMGRLLNDDTVFETGNAMRMKRNTDLYEGGVLISDKEGKDYFRFVEKTIEKVKQIIHADAK